MRRKPKRLYTANDMADGVSAVHQLGLAAIKINPAASGPLAAVPTLGGAGSGPGPVELLEAHCHGCGGKKTFQPEGEEVMENGAIRKHGTAVCGHAVSTFVSAAQNG